MRNRDTLVSVCVNCDAEYSADGVLITDRPAATQPQSHHVPPVQMQPQQELQQPVTREPTAAVDVPASAEEVADAVGAKLLAGWALLDVHCPR